MILWIYVSQRSQPCRVLLWPAQILDDLSRFWHDLCESWHDLSGALLTAGLPQCTQPAQTHLQLAANHLEVLVENTWVGARPAGLPLGCRLPWAPSLQSLGHSVHSRKHHPICQWHILNVMSKNIILQLHIIQAFFLSPLFHGNCRSFSILKNKQLSSLSY